MPLISNTKVTVGCPPQLSSLGLTGEEWTSFSFRIHDYASLDITKGYYIEAPEFDCNGHEWKLKVYPGGNGEATEGNVSAFLHHRSKGKVTAGFAIRIMNKLGNISKSMMQPSFVFSSDSKNCGWKELILRSDILDESQDILDDNGILTIVVSIKEDPSTVFVPKHPLLTTIKEMYSDEATADVCFEVGKCVQDEEKEGKQEKSDSSSVSFHAHRFIVKHCAPMLADLLGESNTATITDIEPHVFDDLLYHIYGGEVSSEELETHAKEIIDAADKYAIINLKLMAEAAYVESTDITFDNAIDNLLYAESKNCALLKEKILDFFAENHYEAAEKISFADFPPQLVKDLLIAVGRKDKDDSSAANVDKLTTLCVSELRRTVYDMGLEVDGSREAMIEEIKNTMATYHLELRKWIS